MSRKRYTPEQIIGKLREAEVALAQGAPGFLIMPGDGMSMWPALSLYLTITGRY